MISKLVRACTVAAIAVSTRVALACPLCSENMSNDVSGGRPSQLGRGFFWSIILMIMIQFALVAVVTLKIVHARRRTRRGTARLHAVPEAP